MNDVYIQGFMDKCAEYGVDAEKLAASIPGVGAVAKGGGLVQELKAVLRRYKGNITGKRMAEVDALAKKPVTDYHTKNMDRAITNAFNRKPGVEPLPEIDKTQLNRDLKQTLKKRLGL